MPLSRAEIQRRYREKKKSQDGEKYLKEERERKKKYYVPVANLSKNDLAKRRTQTLQRVKKHIKTKKERKNAAINNTADTDKTRSKASKKFTLRLEFEQPKKARSVRKRQKTALRQAYRKIGDLQEQNERLIKQKNKYAKRIQRMSFDNKNEEINEMI